MRNQIRKFAFVASVLFTSLSITSCDDDETPMAQETPETITQVALKFSGSSLTTVNATATDSDGDGSGFVFSGTIELKAGSTYTLEPSFLNQLETPIEDVTDEIKEEADEHQIFFTQTGSLATISYADTENDYFSAGCTGCENSTKDVGLKNTVVVTATAGTTGTLNIRLKHQPDGLKTGSVGSGEDDVNLTFDVKII
ncbi:MAG: hypothetical protein ACJAWV_001788 [Flammeovirgaceae bacterium]|jgi:hypothetical protein